MTRSPAGREGRRPRPRVDPARRGGARLRGRAAVRGGAALRPHRQHDAAPEAGDRTLANKFVYRFSEPGRGDTVVFGGAENDGALVKRVVGLPGDGVAAREGALFVNGERAREPCVDYDLADSTFFGPERVPEGRLFAMGDNRTDSLDSRSFAPVPEEDLLGEVFLRLRPPGRAGIGGGDPDPERVRTGSP